MKAQREHPRASCHVSSPAVEASGCPGFEQASQQSAADVRPACCAEASCAQQVHVKAQREHPRASCHVSSPAVEASGCPGFEQATQRSAEDVQPRRCAEASRAQQVHVEAPREHPERKCSAKWLKCLIATCPHLFTALITLRIMTNGTRINWSTCSQVCMQVHTPHACRAWKTMAYVNSAPPSPNQSPPPPPGSGTRPRGALRPQVPYFSMGKRR